MQYLHPIIMGLFVEKFLEEYIEALRICKSGPINIYGILS